MKTTAAVLSVAALTLTSGAAFAYPILPPMKGAPIESAAMTTTRTPAGRETPHVATAAKAAVQSSTTARQRCQVLEHRFDSMQAPMTLKSAETTQGALRAEGGQLCQSQPRGAATYLRAAIAVLNAQIGGAHGHPASS